MRLIKVVTSTYIDANDRSCGRCKQRSNVTGLREDRAEATCDLFNNQPLKRIGNGFRRCEACLSNEVTRESGA